VTSFTFGFRLCFILLKINLPTGREDFFFGELILRKPTVASSTSAARLSLHSSKVGLAWLSLRLQLYVLRLI
jgi:hypothetical protein